MLLKYITWDETRAVYVVEIAVGRKTLKLGRFSEQQEAEAMADAAMFLLGRPRLLPTVLPNKRTLTKVRVRLSVMNKSSGAARSVETGHSRPHQKGDERKRAAPLRTRSRQRILLSVQDSSEVS